MKARRDLFERDTEQRHIGTEDVEVAERATEAKAEGKVDPEAGGT